jgi:hypothetical protein
MTHGLLNFDKYQFVDPLTVVFTSLLIKAVQPSTMKSNHFPREHILFGLHNENCGLWKVRTQLLHII